MTTTMAAPRSSLESSEIPAAIETVREVQDTIDKVPMYLAQFKESYLEKATAGDFGRLGSSQSMISKHPTYPVLMRDEAALQKEYLKKLKSKYIETAAKVAFLSRLGKDDGFVSSEQNEEIEAQNLLNKAELQEQKAQLQQSFNRVSELARELEVEWPQLLKEAKEANRLANEVSEMRLELLRLGRDRPVGERLTIAGAEEVLDDQIVQLEQLEVELASVKEQTSQAKASSEQLEQKMKTLRPQVKAALQAEAMHSRAEPAEDVKKLSHLRDWYTSAEAMYKDLFGLEAVETPSENEVRLSYTQPFAYSVSLIFNPTTNELADAKVSGLDIDITEALDLALISNDGAKFLRYVRMRAQQINVAVS